MPNYKGMHEDELKANIRLRRRLEQVERENERLIEELSQTKKEVTDREDERDQWKLKVCEWQDEHSKAESRLERAEKILRDWQKFELWVDDLGDSADDQDVSDAHYDMAEERDAFLRGD